MSSRLSIWGELKKIVTKNPFYGHVLKMLKHERVEKKNLIEGFNVFKKKCFITF